MLESLSFAAAGLKTKSGPKAALFETGLASRYPRRTVSGRCNRSFDQVATATGSACSRSDVKGTTITTLRRVSGLVYILKIRALLNIFGRKTGCVVARRCRRFCLLFFFFTSGKDCTGAGYCCTCYKSFYEKILTGDLIHREASIFYY